MKVMMHNYTKMCILSDEKSKIRSQWISEEL